MSYTVKTPPFGRRAVDAVRRISDRADVGPGGLLIVAGQLGLLLLVMHAFRVEEQLGLLRLTPIAFGGFVVHALLPRAFRLPFFLVLSLAGIVLLLGPVQGAGLIVLGLGLIGLCHLPVPFPYRVALVLAAGAALAGIRAEWIPTGWSALPTLVLPLLGAMFMFRLAIYLYDLRHERTPASVWERLSYFFLLPNVCFLLFPVIDYQTFRRTYYDGDALPIYRKGLLWMFRGVVQLLLYRAVYYHLVPDPAAVEGLGGVVHSMLATYALYLRISGQFHLIVGMLCLFGFNLPETHHLYLLASSFTDYWRRINIYWKDFMMKLFYYPSLMRLRRWGMTTALVGATLVVFAGTWLLHSYQWFWLRGTFPVTGPDALFWGILGGLVVVNALREAKRTRRRAAPSAEWDPRAAAVLSLRTVGMFAFITVLWSLWSSHSVGEWVALVAKATGSPLWAWGVLLLGLAGLVGVGVAVQYGLARGWSFLPLGSTPSPRRAALVTCGTLVVLLAGSRTPVQEAMGPRVGPVVASLQEQRMNRVDEMQQERGYYEGLLDAEKYTSALWTVQRARNDEWAPTRRSAVVHETGDAREYALVPSFDGTYKEAPFRSNRWGLRDGDYEREKPPGTFRIALLGSSYVMGAGVANDEVFEALLERRLNEERGDRPYEVLNFAVGGYSLWHNVAVAESVVAPFTPDAVILVVHSTEQRRLTRHLHSVLRGDAPDPDPLVRTLLDRVGARADLSEAELARRLEPVLNDVVRRSLQRFAAACRTLGVTPVVVFLPRTEEAHGIDRPPHDALAALADAEGLPFLSAADAFAGYAGFDLQLAPHDTHPNVLGHRLLADRLFHALTADGRVFVATAAPAADTSSPSPDPIR